MTNIKIAPSHHLPSHPLTESQRIASQRAQFSINQLTNTDIQLLLSDNISLHVRNQQLIGQIKSLKRELLVLYEENIEIKENAHNYQGKTHRDDREKHKNHSSYEVEKQEMEGKVSSYEHEIETLKEVIRELSHQPQQRSMQGIYIANEQEEIKDRIIMKLEDQLITTKLMLRESQLCHAQYGNLG